MLAHCSHLVHGRLEWSHLSETLHSVVVVLRVAVSFEAGLQMETVIRFRGSVCLARLVLKIETET